MSSGWVGSHSACCGWIIQVELKQPSQWSARCVWHPTQCSAAPGVSGPWSCSAGGNGSSTLATAALASSGVRSLHRSVAKGRQAAAEAAPLRPPGLANHGSREACGNGLLASLSAAIRSPRPRQPAAARASDRGRRQESSSWRCDATHGQAIGEATGRERVDTEA
eukprot:3887013-Prymnesium_polylepis.2